MIALISVATVLALAGSAAAADMFYYGPGSWSDTSGWYDENGNAMNRLPTIGDWGMINYGAGGGPTVDAPGAVVRGMSIGDTWNGGAGQLTVVAGGDLTTDTGNVLLANGAPGTIQMDGGALTITKDLELRGGGAHIQLNAGTIWCDWMDKWDASSTIDILAGTLTIDWDVSGTIQGGIDNGTITGYGGAGTVHYDVTSNVTTVWATPEPGTLALLGLGGLGILRRRRD
jgi:hypothetical protein